MSAHHPRIRRLKCDETKPACSRCTSTQRVCDFLHPIPIPTPLSQRPKIKSLSPSQPPLLRPKLIPLPSGPFTTEESPHFSFFVTLTTRSLSRHFSDPLWHQLLLQLCHTSPAIRSAVLALSLLIRSQSNTNPPTTRALFRRTSQEKYLYALSTLNRSLDHSTESWGLALVACLLFTEYVVLRAHSHDGESLKHFNAGLKMLRQAPSVCLVSLPSSTEISI